MDPRTMERAVWQRVMGAPDCAQNASGRILELIHAEQREAALYAALAARTAGVCRSVLQQLSREERCHARQLETVFYLLTGSCAQGCPERPACPSGGLCALLRERFAAEQQAAEGYRGMAETSPRFRDVFLHLAADETRHAARLRCLLQQLLR